LEITAYPMWKDSTSFLGASTYSQLLLLLSGHRCISHWIS